MTIFDLSQPLDEDVPVYPGDPTVSLNPHASHDADGYRVTALSLGSHSGTHIDAPAHTEPNGVTLDSFPVETFSMDAVKLDCTGYRAGDPIPPTVLPTDPDADTLVFHTGWDAHWPEERYLVHPYLAPETASRVAELDCHVGIDALNVDPTGSDGENAGDSAGVPAHHAILGAGNLIVENLTNLGAVPQSFRLDVAPLPVTEADAAPVRAIGRTE
ncbi:cyclase family protein [Natranaeroarchaeum aerophilus]|uniref:Cyclase family protein n=1 Tax=Natranaeroarchaeum aerophilus TaxID=2917711 RepID=A0AAE3FTN1_9EURY|nr:cyclase family protein [Natranaeroarchaeum aerophilus]MCL9814713.1 cyclase family protein [Natranaeroarchaeum aerophilus]